MITIKLHRWQAKTKRYNTQTLNLEDGRPYLDLIAGRGAGVSQLIDPAVEQKILRTQQIDRVNVQTMFDNSGVAGEPELINVTIDVYLSPFQGRNYPEKQRPGLVRTFLDSNVSKSKHDDSPRCVCFHRHIEHSSNFEGTTVCLVPGCNCKSYIPQNRKSVFQLKNRLEVNRACPKCGHAFESCLCISPAPSPAGQ